MNFHMVGNAIMILLEVHMSRVENFTLCINTDDRRLIVASAQKSHGLPEGPPPPPTHLPLLGSIRGVHVQKNIDESNIDGRKTQTTPPTPTLA